MSFSTRERLISGRSELGAYPRSLSGDLFDADPFSLAQGDPNPSRYTSAITLIGAYDRHHGRTGNLLARIIVTQQADAMRSVGSCLADLNFAVFDYTGTETDHVSQLVKELVLGSGSRAQALVLATPAQSDEEPFTTDFDRPLDGVWLASAFDAIFSGIAEDDLDLEFDPDESSGA